MFNLANIITSLNLLSGVLSILMSFSGRLDLAVLMIFCGAVFDFMDGMAARKLNQQGELGKQLDSLADVVTFGVAPGVFMMVIMMITVPAYMSRPYPEMMRYDFFGELSLILEGESTYYVPFVALLIPLFSMFRLAKFNIDKRQSDRFIGLPTPANTLFFTTFPMIIALPDYSPAFMKQWVDEATNPYFLSIVVTLFSLLLVAEIPLFSLKFKHFGWKGNEIRFIFLLISLVIIIVLRTWSPALIVFLYLILSLIEKRFSKQQQHEIQSGN